jgi:hypothetical protein
LTRNLPKLVEVVNLETGAVHSTIKVHHGYGVNVQGIVSQLIVLHHGVSAEDAAQRFKALEKMPTPNDRPRKPRSPQQRRPDTRKKRYVRKVETKKPTDPRFLYKAPAIVYGVGGVETVVTFDDLNQGLEDFGTADRYEGEMVAKPVSAGDGNARISAIRERMGGIVRTGTSSNTNGAAA